MVRRRDSLKASARIAFDLAHSVLRPPRPELPGEAPNIVERAARHEPRAPGHQLRLVSWNIHRNYRPREVAASLARLVAEQDPDLLLLQEVPVYPQGAFWEQDEVVELLAGFHVRYVPMHRVRRQNPYYPFLSSGLATFSRLPLSSTRAVPLPAVSRPKLGPTHQVRRVALATTHAWPAQRLAVLNLHLENTTSPGGRRRQIQHLLEQLLPVAEPLVLGGDLNTMLGPLETLWRELGRRRIQVPSRVAGSRLAPRLDHFGVLGCESARFLRLRAVGSDHQPIGLELELTPDNPAP